MKGTRMSGKTARHVRYGACRASEAVLRIANGQIVTTMCCPNTYSLRQEAMTLNYSAVRSIRERDHLAAENPVSQSANVRTDGVRATSFLLSCFFFFPAVHHEPPPVVAPGWCTNDPGHAVTRCDTSRSQEDRR